MYVYEFNGNNLIPTKIVKGSWAIGLGTIAKSGGQEEKVFLNGAARCDIGNKNNARSQFLELGMGRKSKISKIDISK